MSIKVLPTGKRLGFVKGDFVYTGAFPGIIISDVHTTTPCCEVWGFEQEIGSAYATDMRKVSYKLFLNLCKFEGHDPNNLKARSELAREVLRNFKEDAEVVNNGL